MINHEETPTAADLATQLLALLRGKPGTSITVEDDEVGDSLIVLHLPTAAAKRLMRMIESPGLIGIEDDNEEAPDADA